MNPSNSLIIIIAVLAFAFYLIYSNNHPSYQIIPQYMSQYHSIHNKSFEDRSSNSQFPQHPPQHPPQQPLQQPNVINVAVDGGTDPYSDAIKKQDLYTMYDPLTYPQLRLPREVLDRYNEHYERTGTYPPFNQYTQPYLFDNPVLNGVLIKCTEDNEPFNDNIPSSVPLFRVKSSKNANRFFYYIIDQRYLSKVEPKIPLDHVRINGIRYDNADFYGIPELFDGDIIEHIPIYPDARFKITLYKTYHFP